MSIETNKGILLATRDLSYPGGTETFIENYAKHLITNGFNVYLLETDSHGNFSNARVYNGLIQSGLRCLTPTGTERTNFRTSECTNEIINSVAKYRLNIVHSFLFNADFSVWLAKIGSSEVNRQILNHPYSDQIIELVRSEIPVYHHSAPSDFLWFSSKFSEFSVALEKETPEWKKRKRIIDSFLEPMVSNDADHIICASTSIANKWSEYNDHISVIPCASISHEEFEEISGKSATKETIDRFIHKQLRFVCVSRLVPGKGIENLIEGFGKYSLLYPDSHLTIIGDGPLGDNIKNKDNKNIEVTGHLPREKVFEALEENDVFCLFSDSEGLPLSIQEAMSRGKLVLATNVGGVCDLVVDGKNGFLADSNEPQSIFETMKHLNTLMPDEFICMGNSSRDRIRSLFLRESAFQANINLYRQQQEALND